MHPSSSSRLATLCGAVLLAAACRGSAPEQSLPGGATSAAMSGEWRWLFDGTSTDAWRGYRAPTFPSGWRIEDGALVRAARGGDIITKETFRDFELELEWKIAPGGNSGVMYRVTEAAGAPYETGPEMQVLDDARHPDGRSPLTSAGSLFGLYPSRPGVVRPAGEWNQARIVMRGNHVEHWLNGQKVVDADIGSPDWTARVKASKFAAWSGFGVSPEGHIAIQDHGDWVAYRNIRIRR